MKIIRKILLLSVNTDWSNELKNLLEENQKISVEIATTRTAATKIMTDIEFEAVVIEDTFKIKNMDYFLRALTSQKFKPHFVYFTFSDFKLYSTVLIPEELEETTFKAFSLPMAKNTLKDLIFTDLLPYSSESTSEFDKEFLTVLLKSGKNVLKSLNVTDITNQKPVLLSKMDLKPEIAIRGKIIIKSEFFNGSLFISFPKETYQNIYKSMVGEEIDEINDSNKDFSGEIANMIYGQAKKELEEHGVKLDMAIPVVDETKKIESKSAIFVIPFDTSVGPIFIKLAPGYF